MHRVFAAVVACFGLCVGGVAPLQAGEMSGFRMITRIDDPSTSATMDSARPGEAFFARAVSAQEKGQAAFAVDMFRAAASWAYKSAQYNLGLIHYRGIGVPEDRALGMAWLALAAERGDPDFVRARDAAYRDMSAIEFERANELYREMAGSYGDANALRRARNRWKQVIASQGGAHPGSSILVASRGASGTEAVDMLMQGGAGHISGSGADDVLRGIEDPYGVEVRGANVSVGDVIPISPDALHDDTHGSGR